MVRGQRKSDKLKVSRKSETEQLGSLQSCPSSCFVPERLTAQQLLRHNGHRSRGHGSLLGSNQINKSPCVVLQQCGGKESFRQIKAIHAKILMNGAGGSYQHTKPSITCSATIVLTFSFLSRE